MVLGWATRLRLLLVREDRQLGGNLPKLLSAILAHRKIGKERGKHLGLPLKIRSLSVILHGCPLGNDVDNLPYSADGEIEDRFVRPAVLRRDEVDGAGVSSDDSGIGSVDTGRRAGVVVSSVFSCPVFVII
jgi:hypothetical protein